MKARTIAATAIALAMAAPATATAQAVPSEENRAKTRACFQEALATKTGLSAEDVSDLADHIVKNQGGDEPLLLSWTIDEMGDMGLLEPKVCESVVRRFLLDEDTKEEWIGLAIIVRGKAIIARDKRAQADSEAAATGTAPPP